MTLKELRKSKGITLATVACEVDCCISMLSKIENNKIYMQPYLKERLKAFFQVEEIETPVSTERLLKRKIKQLLEENASLKREQTRILREMKTKKAIYENMARKINVILEKRNADGK